MSANGIARYVDASYRTYGVVLDAVTDAGRRRRQFWRSVWKIVSRPRDSRAPRAQVRDGVERAQEFVELAASELRNRSKKRVEFSRELLAAVDGLQDAALDTYRGSFRTATSGLRRPSRRNVPALTTGRREPSLRAIPAEA